MKMVYVCFMFLIIACSIAPALGSEGGYEALEMRAECPDEILPGLPVDVTLRLKNRGTDKVILPFFPPGRRMMRVIVVDEEENVLYDDIVEQSLSSFVMFRPPVQLDPAQEVSFDVTVTVSWEGERRTRERLEALFLVPGVYTMSFVYRIRWSERIEGHGVEWKSHDVRSVPRKIRVLNPADMNHATAWTAFNGLSKPASFIVPEFFVEAAIMYSQRKLLREWDDEAKEYTQNHGESPWAALAWHVRAIIARSNRLWKEQAEFAQRAIELAKAYDLSHTVRLNEALLSEALRELCGKRGQSRNLDSVEKPPMS